MENGASDKSNVSYSNRVIMDFDSQVESHSQDFITFLIGSFRLPSPHVTITSYYYIYIHICIYIYLYICIYMYIYIFFPLKARRLSLSWLAGCSYTQAKPELKGVFES